MGRNTARRWRVLSLALLLGCGASNEPPKDVAPLDHPSDPSPTISQIDWKPIRFEEGRMSLDVIAAPYGTHKWDRGGVVSQTVRLDEDSRLSILLRAGEGEGLASFRRDHRGKDNKFSAVTEDRVCGRTSKRLELSEPEQHIECIMFADGRPNSPGYISASTTVVHHFQHAGLDVVASWEIVTKLRERHRADEQRFFASLRCH